MSRACAALTRRGAWSVRMVVGAWVGARGLQQQMAGQAPRSWVGWKWVMWVGVLGGAVVRKRGEGEGCRA